MCFFGGSQRDKYTLGVQSMMPSSFHLSGVAFAHPRHFENSWGVSWLMPICALLKCISETLYVLTIPIVPSVLPSDPPIVIAFLLQPSGHQILQVFPLIAS